MLVDVRESEKTEEKISKWKGASKCERERKKIRRKGRKKV